VGCGTGTQLGLYARPGCRLVGIDPEAAAQLFLSVRTVKWYTPNIYAKLDVSSRTQAIAKARQLRILPE